MYINLDTGDRSATILLKGKTEIRKMATRKCSKATQTDTRVVQRSESETQTGPTPYKATSGTYGKEGERMINEIQLTPSTLFQLDSLAGGRRAERHKQARCWGGPCV